MISRIAAENLTGERVKCLGRSALDRPRENLRFLDSTMITKPIIPYFGMIVNKVIVEKVVLRLK